jgi:hypothetical protein
MRSCNVARRTWPWLTWWRAVALALGCTGGAFALTTNSFVSEQPLEGSFCLFGRGITPSLVVDTNDWPGVARAAADLRADIARVARTGPARGTQPGGLRTNLVLVGTLGRSAAIERLVREGKIDVAAIAGKWEAALIQVVNQPFPGVDSALVIAGSDRRGAIFGCYDLSEQIGVSPWYWWADVLPKPHRALYVKAGRHLLGPPAVKYRGIFINDEGPCFMSWAREKYGGLNHGVYTNVFELILRLKGNFLWPAMWDNSFATDDPLNAKLADEYGVIIGTSHHEPMMRAWKEWERAGNPKGSWDYAKNGDKLREFWTEGLRRTKDCEKVITLGMRGDGDEPMTETAGIALLERIVADQRKIIGEIVRPQVTEVPQVWALYKEVQGYYERGLRVPEDVTLLWCDDNWGNLRRLPTADERKRPGGAGIYYHLDYVGGPRSYKWLNTVPLPKIWEQMNLAWHYGADRLWIVNVGDIKPEEVPMEFFLTLAWNPQAWPRERLGEYLRRWADREFGPSHAVQVADVVAEYARLNGRRKPELLDADTFSLLHYQEADRVVANWKALKSRATGIYDQLPQTARAAFYQLVLHPVRACEIVNELYVAAGKNALYARQGRAGANDLAARVRQLFDQDQERSAYYNLTLANGKWNHMMDQTHIGYTSWQQPETNTMPAVVTLSLPEAAGMGVAVEGSGAAWPGTTNDLVLPVLDAFNRESHFVDVFNRGKAPFSFTATSSVPWLELSSAGGTITNEERLWVTVNWTNAPKGWAQGAVQITQTGATGVFVRLRAFNPPEPAREALDGFVEADGCVAIEAAHFTGKADTAAARWEMIDGLGRTLSAMSIFPVTAPSAQPPENSPRLEYRMYLFSTGMVEVTSILEPCLNFAPDRGVRLAVSFDDAAPQVVTVVPKGYFVDNGNHDWEEAVKESARKVKSRHAIAQPGYHTLKVWMVDPGVAVQRIVVDAGGLRPSYLGPPESYRQGTGNKPLPPPVETTAQQDHRRMMELLQITSLRRGAEGMNRRAPNHANYDESKANPFPTLPDPLLLSSGGKVRSARTWWEQRRPEIVADFDREIYGRVPTNTPRVDWEVVSSGPTIQGTVAAVTKHLVGHVDNSSCPPIQVDIQLTLTAPTKAATPVPVVMELAFEGFGTSAKGRRPGAVGDARTRGASSPSVLAGSNWQEAVLRKGWGYAVLLPTSVQADSGAGLTKGIIGLCNQGQRRKPDDWGALRAWAWGASRALDYFETDGAVDAKRVAIEGHSRYGKAALVAMAYDQRFAAAFISSSGEGGAKLHRRNWGELVENLAASGEYHWMAGNFLKYAGPLTWSDLPVDSHELIALCAPRPVFISAGSTNGDAWVDAKGMFLAAAGAGPVYELLGKAGVGTAEFPPIETSLTAGEVAFRQHSGGHTPGPNWPIFLEWAERYFKDPPGPAAPPPPQSP